MLQSEEVTKLEFPRAGAPPCVNFLNQEFISQEYKQTKMLIAPLFVRAKSLGKLKCAKNCLKSSHCNPHDEITVLILKERG